MNRSSIKQIGVFLHNVRFQPAPIEGVNTSSAAFLGQTQTGPTAPTLVASWADYQNLFGSYFGDDNFMPYAVEGFFANGGQNCFVCRVSNGDFASALTQLEAVEDVSIVYAPNAQSVDGLSDLLIDHCERLGRFVIFDSQKGQDTYQISKPRQTSFAAVYYPWIKVKESGTGKICLTLIQG
jgi:phage tail sheath protein FI